MSIPGGKGQVSNWVMSEWKSSVVALSGSTLQSLRSVSECVKMLSGSAHHLSNKPCNEVPGAMKTASTSCARARCSADTALTVVALAAGDGRSKRDFSLGLMGP